MVRYTWRTLWPTRRLSIGCPPPATNWAKSIERTQIYLEESTFLFVVRAEYLSNVEKSLLALFAIHEQFNSTSTLPNRTRVNPGRRANFYAVDSYSKARDVPIDGMDVRSARW